MRVLFMGTPEFARRVLEALATLPGNTVRAVSQPDRPKGRGMRLQPSSVSAWALDHGLPLDRPQRLSDYADSWRAFAPDLLITAAYGRILPPWLLRLPRCGAYNLHASLLPRWRGPNPVGWALWAGDPVTGVTLMRMAEGVDAGPIVASRPLAISQEWDCGQLTAALAEEAAELIRAFWPRLCDPALPLRPQEERDATYAPKFPPEMGRVRWEGEAEEEARRIRAVSPDPGAYAFWGDQRLKLAGARAEAVALPVGEARLCGEDWIVGCRVGSLRIARVQPAGKRWMRPAEWLRGRAGTEATVKLT
jgi:methionyl-tRNA formyltransferase